MKSHTYYDILGVSRDATLDKITTAKNALAKVYHPDANAHKNIDTTAFMQEILEAYRVLSNPEKRRKYNQETFGETERVFKTFTLTPENEEENTGSFVTYWNMSNQLRTILNKSIRLMKQETQKKTLTQRVFQKWGKYQKEETIRNQQIAKLSTQAVQYITALKMAGIPMDYWSSDAMNWILVRWGQKQSVDYHTLFSRYDDYVEETLSNSEKIRLKNQNKTFSSQFKKTALLRFKSVRGSHSKEPRNPFLHLCKSYQSHLYTTDLQCLFLFPL